MIIEALDEYLETLAGYIFDDDKLVTYKWLSKELEVHVDVAKQILWKFWQRYKDKKSFDCTFLLMGILHDEGMRVEIVKEPDMVTAKEKYVEILSEHVYSLQKVLSKIQLLEMTENGDVKYSAIKCIENNERSDEEMHILRWGVMLTELQPVPQEKSNLVSESVNAQKDTCPEKKVEKEKNIQKRGFDNLFGKAMNKQKNTSTYPDTNKVETSSTSYTNQTFKDNIPKSTKKTTQSGLNSFFQQSKNEEGPVDIVSSEATNNKISILKKVTENKTISENSKNHNKNIHGKKRNRNKDISPAAKKRKRITIQSDSSDTESSDTEQKEELNPLSEKISPVKVHSDSPPPIKLENGKRKVLKIVDQTFEEDGYFVTKKVHVYESCSEDESEIAELKKSAISQSDAEKKVKKNTKQTTLMNFFRKV